MRGRRAWVGLVLPGGFLLVPVFGSVVAIAWPEALKATLAGFSSGLHGTGASGLIILFMVQVCVAASGVLPASLVGLAAGAIYGVAWGFPLAAGSLLAGALLTFGLSRSMFRTAVARVLATRPRLNDLDAGVARDGWPLVCLLRVSPVMPFAATSYALGLTSIGWTPYLLGTLASLPALLGYVTMGSFAGAMTTSAAKGLDVEQLGLLAAGLVATVLVTLRVGWLVWHALQPLGQAPRGLAASARRDHAGDGLSAAPRP